MCACLSARRPDAVGLWGAEEVYACEFLGGGAAGRHLCTASSDSLYLWDLETGAFLQRCAPAVAGKRSSDAGVAPKPGSFDPKPQKSSDLRVSCYGIIYKFWFRPPLDLFKYSPNLHQGWIVLAQCGYVVYTRE